MKPKTNRMEATKTKTVSYAMYHKLKLSLCRNKIHFHLLLTDKSLDKLLRVELLFSE